MTFWNIVSKNRVWPFLEDNEYSATRKTIYAATYYLRALKSSALTFEKSLKIGSDISKENEYSTTRNSFLSEKTPYKWRLVYRKVNRKSQKYLPHQTWRKIVKIYQVYQIALTIILLNNLISHTHFWLSANQITPFNVFVQIHKLNDKQSRSWSDGIWSGSKLFPKVGVFVNSRIRVKVSSRSATFAGR